MNHRRKILKYIALMVAALLPAAALAGPGALARVEASYADWLDTNYAIASLVAGPWKNFDGRDLAGWRRLLEPRRAQLEAEIAELAGQHLSDGEARALAMLKKGFAEPWSVPEVMTATESAAACAMSSNPNLDRTALSAALYACFDHYGNRLEFEGQTVSRRSALALLESIEEPARREALLAAFAPLWTRVHPAGANDSPYQRLLRLEHAAVAAGGRSIAADAAQVVGVAPLEAEQWMESVLARWREVAAPEPLEPWDYWHAHAAAFTALGVPIPPAAIQDLSARYYADLGADLGALGVLHDLEVRPGKVGYAYCDFVRIGRETRVGWRPAIPRVAANIDRGGLGLLNELVHEDGHAVHYAAIRTRPAYFISLDDVLFDEAMADVAAWSTGTHEWQQRYLGQGVEPRAAGRSLYAMVMLEVAWGLFEARLLRDPTLEPNATWTDITSRYLNVRPHPELPWWMLRTQLVESPGYLIYYGAGAILTADLRRRIRERIGDFDAGNPRWYRLVSEQLLRYGGSVERSEQLRKFLGRPVSPQALLEALDQLRPPPRR